MILNLPLPLRLRNLNRSLIYLRCKRSTRGKTAIRILLIIILIGGIHDILLTIAGEGKVEGLGGDLFSASVGARGLDAFNVGTRSGILATVDELSRDDCSSISVCISFIICRSCGSFKLPFQNSSRICIHFGSLHTPLAFLLLLDYLRLLLLAFLFVALLI